MLPATLILITGDPRTSHRPAEAIRIAAGVGTWKRTTISLYLRGPAVLALSEYADGFVDEDNFVRYLPHNKGLGHPAYVQQGAPLLAELGEATLPFEEITDARLAELAAMSDYVLRF